MQTTLFIVSPCLSGGGAEKVAVSLANSWAKKDFKVIILLFKPNNDYQDILDQSVDLIVLNSSVVIAIFQIARLLFQYKPRYVLSVIRESSILLALPLLLTRVFRLKIFFAAREASPLKQSLQTYPLIRRYLYPFLLFFVYRFFDIIISNSPFTKESVITSLFLRSSSSIVIPNPAFLESNHKHSSSLSLDPQTQLLLNSSHRLILSIARFVSNKNHSCLLKLFNCSIHLP